MHAAENDLLQSQANPYWYVYPFIPRVPHQYISCGSIKLESNWGLRNEFAKYFMESCRLNCSEPGLDTNSEPLALASKNSPKWLWASKNRVQLVLQGQ